MCCGKCNGVPPLLAEGVSPSDFPLHIYELKCARSVLNSNDSVIIIFAPISNQIKYTYQFDYGRKGECDTRQYCSIGLRGQRDSPHNSTNRISCTNSIPNQGGEGCDNRATSGHLSSSYWISFFLMTYCNGRSDSYRCRATATAPFQWYGYSGNNTQTAHYLGDGTYNYHRGQNKRCSFARSQTMTGSLQCFS